MNYRPILIVVNVILIGILTHIVLEIFEDIEDMMLSSKSSEDFIVLSVIIAQFFAAFFIAVTTFRNLRFSQSDTSMQPAVDMLLDDYFMKNQNFHQSPVQRFLVVISAIVQLVLGLLGVYAILTLGNPASNVFLVYSGIIILLFSSILSLYHLRRR